MTIVSSAIIIRAVSVLHLTAAYFLLFEPSRLPEQNLVLIFSEAMRLPNPSHFSDPTPTSALAAVVLALFAFSDLTAAGLAQFAFDEYWSAQAPIRILLWFILTAWVYVNGRGQDLITQNVLRSKDWDKQLQNGLMFTIGFVEMSVMFWIYLTLREERKEKAEAIVEKKKQEEDRL